MLDKTLYIDDQPHESAIIDELKKEYCYTTNNATLYPTLYSLADAVKRNTGDDKVILINIHFEFKRDGHEDTYPYLQSCAGIDLLKMLRLLGETRHCVLYSPMSVTELLRLKPGNLIITSKGVTVKNKYSELKDFLARDLSKLPQAEKHFPKEYFKVDFQMPEDNRHNWANWWGIYRLWDVHRFIGNENLYINEKGIIKEVEEILETESPIVAQKIKTLKGIQAKFLYGFQQKEIERDIQNCELKSLEKQKKQNNEWIDAYNKDNEDLNKEINNLQIGSERIKSQDVQKLKAQKLQIQNSKKSPIKRYTRSIANFFMRTPNDDEIIKGYDASINIFLDEIKNNEKDISIKKLSIGMHEKEIAKYEEKNIATQKRIDIIKYPLINKQLSNLDNTKYIKEYRQELQKLLKTTLVESEKHILYIDDQEDEGWFKIFRLMILGNLKDKEEKLFISYKPNSQKIDEVIKEVMNKINEMTAFVLLDLRLLSGETGSIMDVENLSGKKALDEIRKKYKGLPVIITTASNKAWSYETIMKYDADAFWIKEGIDENRTSDNSIINYKNLLEIVYKLNSDEYLFFTRFSKQVEELKTNVKPWWNKHNWKWTDENGSSQTRTIKIDIIMTNNHHESEVTKIIDITLKQFRQYLYNFVIQENRDDRHKQRVFSNIIMSLASIIELIHCGIYKNKIIGGWFNIKTGAWYKARNDIIAMYLMEFRAKASHHHGVKTISFELLKIFISGIMAWLLVKDYVQIDNNNKQFNTIADWQNIINYYKTMDFLKKFYKVIKSDSSILTEYNKIIS